MRLLGVGFLLVLGCSSPSKTGGGFPPAIVKLANVQPKPIEQSTDLIGELNSRHSIQLNPQVSGYLKAIRVRAGQTVKTGAVLFEIDSAKEGAVLRNLMAVRNARQAAVQLAEANEARARRLAPSGVVSQQELQQAETGLASARADFAASESQVRAQEVQVGYYRIAAPYDGTIGDIPVKVGDFVTPQTVLTLLNQSAALEVYVRVPLPLAPKLSESTIVQLLDDADKVIADGKVQFIAPTVDPSTQSVLVKTLLANQQGLKTSQYVRVRLIWGKAEALTVPTVAVVRQSGQYFVFVAEKGAQGLIAQERNVQLGDIYGNDFIVKEGLSAGEQVVISGTQKVRPGAPLRPES